jgi:hypothetical protein
VDTAETVVEKVTDVAESAAEVVSDAVGAVTSALPGRRNRSSKNSDE